MGIFEYVSVCVCVCMCVLKRAKAILHVLPEVRFKVNCVCLGFSVFEINFKLEAFAPYNLIRILNYEQTSKRQIHRINCAPWL